MGFRYLVAMVTCAMLLRVETKSFDTETLRRALDLLREDDGPFDTSPEARGKPDYSTLFPERGADGTEDFTDLFPGGRADDVTLRTLPHDAAGFDARSLGGERSSEPETRGTTKLSVDVCYFCDNNCKQDIVGLGGDNAANPNTFFSDVNDKVTARYNTLSGYSFTITPFVIVYPNAMVPATAYKTTSKTGLELMSNIANNFWEANGLFAAAQGAGCDVAFFAVSTKDSVWSKSDGVDGVGNMFQMCNSMSFGLLKLFKTNTEKMATLVAHEMGHIFGIYHDDAVNSAFTKNPSVFDMSSSLKSAYDTLLDQCTSSNHNCAKGQNKCVMRIAGGAENKFSGCSKAYLDVFMEMTKTPGLTPYYKSACVASGKRELDARGDDEQEVKFPPM